MDLEWGPFYGHLESPSPIETLRQDSTIAEDPVDLAAQVVQWGSVNWATKSFRPHFPLEPPAQLKSEPILVPPRFALPLNNINYLISFVTNLIFFLFSASLRPMSFSLLLAVGFVMEHR